MYTYKVEHKKRNFIFTNSHVLFYELYKYTNDGFLDDFPKISGDNFFQTCPRPDKHFHAFFKDCVKANLVSHWCLI